jgi:hypothetical protein
VAGVTSNLLVTWRIQLLCERDPGQRFANEKAQYCQELADALERDQVDGLQDDTTLDAGWLLYEMDSQGRIKIEIALVVSVELYSLTLQRDDRTIANVIAASLFGDGAAATVVTGAQAADGRAAGLPTIAFQKSTGSICARPMWSSRRSRQCGFEPTPPGVTRRSPMPRP